MHKKIGTGFIKRCVCLVFLVVMMCGCANKSDSQNKVQDTAKPMAAQSFTGVITSVDKELKQLSVREIDTDVDTIINYDDTAEIKDKYKQDIYGDELEQGMIMKTTYRTSDAKLVSMEVPEDAWSIKMWTSFLLIHLSHQWKLPMNYISIQNRHILAHRVTRLLKWWSLVRLMNLRCVG